MTIATVNPATGQTLRTFVPLSESELDSKIQRAAQTFKEYRRTPLAQRTRLLLRAAEILEAEKEKFGRLMVTEMGKTLKAAIEEAVPADVLTAALFVRFRSRQEHTFAEKILSAMRMKFGGHVEKK